MPATSYNVSGASGGHQKTSVTWTVTLVGGDFSGTITATPGGGIGQCQIFSPSIITFAGDGTLSKTFSFTPLNADSVTYTFTNSGSLANPSPVTFTSTAMYLKDTFSGTSGSLLSDHTSDAIPGIPGGSSWGSSTGGGTIELTGSGGMLFGTWVTVGQQAISLTSATLPSTGNYVNGSLAGQLEVQYDFVRVSSITGTYAGCFLMSSTGTVIYFQYEEGANAWWLKQWTSGVTSTLASYFSSPAIGTVWRIKIDVVIGSYVQNQYTTFAVYYSTNGGSTWSTMIAPFITNTSTNPTAFAVGPMFQYIGETATTGLHVGNLVVQDIPPPAPNCHLSKAYVSSSGQSAGCEFTTISSGSLVTPTALNYLPSFFQNGTSINVAQLDGVPDVWINGRSTRLVIPFAAGVTIAASDVVTMSAPDSWITCGSGNASNGITGLSLTNYTGVSAFGTDTLVKTLRPGFNISGQGTSSGSPTSLMANLRYRLDNAQPSWIAQHTSDGYPTAVGNSNIFMTFYTFGTPNAIDNTLTPGVPGYYAIGYDDNSYGTPNQCDLTVLGNSAGNGSAVTTQVTVTQTHSCDNTGANGVGQFYLFNVTPTSGSPNVDLPIGLNWHMPQYNSSAGMSNSSYNHPNISNLFILGPGDFTYTLGVPLSFDRSNPYRLSNHFLSTVANGCGVLRFMDSFLSFGGHSNTSESWEMRKLIDFSWNNTSYLNTQVGLTQIRGLFAANSPYFYGDPTTLPLTGESWTSASTLAADMTTIQTTLTLSGLASADPVFYGLLLTIDSEWMRVRGVSGSTVTVERGSSGSAPATHLSGAAITISSRWSWASGGSNPLSKLGGGATCVVEVLTNGNHNLKSGQSYNLNGSFPVMTFTDINNTTTSGTLSTQPVWPTGPTSYATIVYYACPIATTIASGTTYTLNPSSCYLQCNEPEVGFPLEMIGQITSAINGCNTYVCFPLMCSDSYAYAAFAKLLVNTVSGRKIYVELADEIWNGPSSISIADQLLGRWNGKGSLWWSIFRTLQLRTIGRAVFATVGRENEILATINVQCAQPSVGASQLAFAQSIGIPVDAYAVAPYMDVNQEDSSCTAANVSAWNGCASIPQMADLAIHDLLFNSTNVNVVATLPNHAAGIASYNTATGANCVLIGYEGGYQNVVPNGCGNTAGLGHVELPGVNGAGYGNLVPYWNHDIQYDPIWRIYEKDLFAALQHYRLVEFATYAHTYFAFYQAEWRVYSWAYQLPGKGDGSDGLSNNRTCLATPGQSGTKATGVNQDQFCVSVRGQAQLEWMQSMAITTARLSGPTSGTVGIASSNFTITLDHPL